MTALSIDIIHEDNHTLGVVKPAGLLVQGDSTGDTTALELAKSYIKEKHGKPGKVFLGLVHRIDRPVSGIVVFARTSKAASRLARAFHDRRVDKRYLAVVSGELPLVEDRLEGYMVRDKTKSRLVHTGAPGAKAVSLTYRVLDTEGPFSLVEVTPLTGRHHQIRVQLAAEGAPIAGDMKYGASEALPDRAIALHAAGLRLPHPTRDELIELTSAPPLGLAPWKRLSVTIAVDFPTDE
jgi:23S rRNA pseudouridine1911/1915/1917 synthase